MALLVSQQLQRKFFSCRRLRVLRWCKKNQLMIASTTCTRRSAIASGRDLAWGEKDLLLTHSSVFFLCPFLLSGMTAVTVSESPFVTALPRPHISDVVTARATRTRRRSRLSPVGRRGHRKSGSASVGDTVQLVGPARISPTPAAARGQACRSDRH